MSGLTPDPGLTESPVHRGGLLVGVGVIVGVIVGVGVTVGEGVTDGVVVGVVERSALLRTSALSVRTAHRSMGRPNTTIRIMVRNGRRFIQNNRPLMSIYLFREKMRVCPFRVGIVHENGMHPHVAMV